MFNLDQSIIGWRKQMLASGIQSPVPLEELESHLRDHIQQLTASGQSEADALAIAAARLGDAPTLKKEFTKVSPNRFAIWRGNPASLNLIALWFLIVGMNAAFHLRIWARWDLGGHSLINFGLALNLLLVVQILIGLGLGLRRNFFRYLALSWSGLVLAFFAFSLASRVLHAQPPGAQFLDSSLGISVIGGPNGTVSYYFLKVALPLPFLHIISALNVAVLLSTFYFLTRPHIRQLFRRDSLQTRNLKLET